MVGVRGTVGKHRNTEKRYVHEWGCPDINDPRYKYTYDMSGPTANDAIWSEIGFLDTMDWEHSRDEYVISKCVKKRR